MKDKLTIIPAKRSRSTPRPASQSPAQFAGDFERARVEFSSFLDERILSHPQLPNYRPPMIGFYTPEEERILRSQNRQLKELSETGTGGSKIGGVSNKLESLLALRDTFPLRSEAISQFHLKLSEAEKSVIQEREEMTNEWARRERETLRLGGLDALMSGLNPLPHRKAEEKLSIFRAELRKKLEKNRALSILKNQFVRLEMEKQTLGNLAALSVQLEKAERG